MSRSRGLIWQIASSPAPRSLQSCTAADRITPAAHKDPTKSHLLLRLGLEGALVLRAPPAALLVRQLALGPGGAPAIRPVHLLGQPHGRLAHNLHRHSGCHPDTPGMACIGTFLPLGAPCHPCSTPCLVSESCSHTQHQIDRAQGHWWVLTARSTTTHTAPHHFA